VLDLIDDKEVVVVLTKKGLHQDRRRRRVPTPEPRWRGVRGSRTKDDDYVGQAASTTTAALVPAAVFRTAARCIGSVRTSPHEGPHRARGTALVNLITLPKTAHRAIIDTRTYEEGAVLCFATKNGMVKKTRMTEIDPRTGAASSPSNLARTTSWCGSSRRRSSQRRRDGQRNGQTIRFAESLCGVPPGDATAGVAGMKLRQDDSVVSADVYRRGAVMLFITRAAMASAPSSTCFHKQGEAGRSSRDEITRGPRRVVGSLHRHRRRRDPRLLLRRQHHPHAPASDVSTQGRNARRTGAGRSPWRG